MNKNVVWAVFILLIVIWIWFLFSGKSNLASIQTVMPLASTNKEVEVVTGLIGSEKKLFFQDPEVIKIFKEKYNLDIHFTTKWSLAMADNTVGQDFIFPGSKTVSELLQNRKTTYLKKESIFYSPLVVYSWKDIVSTLERKGLVTTTGTWLDSIKTLNLTDTVQLILEGKKWDEIWGDKSYWNIKIFSTNPLESNSGNMFAGLLFNILNGDTVKIKSIFNKMWLLTWGSDTIFKDYLQMQSGMYQLLVGYENQVIEYYNENENYKEFIKENVVILYSNPTIFADHEMITFTDKGNHLLIALQDKDLLDLAWKKYGFRNIMSSKINQEVVGISKQQVKNVINMPSISDIEQLLLTLKTK